MYYDSSISNSTNTPHESDFVLSPIELRENRRKAPATPPSPPSPLEGKLQFKRGGDPKEIPWGDRKPAAKPNAMTMSMPANAYDTSAFDESDIEVDIEEILSKTKDGVLFPKNPPFKNNQTPEKKAIGNSVESTDSHSHSHSSQSNKTMTISKNGNQQQGPGTSNIKNNNGRMSKRELFWAAFVFSLIVLITVVTTAVVMTRETGENSATKRNSNTNSNSDGSTPSPTSTPLNPSDGTDPSSQNENTILSIEEEWELVHSAIRNNNVARVLLLGRDVMDEDVPYDLSFYENLVAGMVFSEEERDWIPVSPQNDVDTIDADIDIDDDATRINSMSLDGMSMSGEGGTYGEFGNNGSSSSNNNKANRSNTPFSQKMTPNQKATAWLLFHDDRKDPDESVWRWAMASIYFKMGGGDWNFQNMATTENKWFTGAPLCDWERFAGSSGCDKHKQQLASKTGAPLLPVELDFDDTNMAGPIAIEFALLLLPASRPPTAVATTTVGNIDTTVAAALTTTNTLVRSITLTDNQLVGTIPGAVFQHLMPSLGKLYLDNNQLTGEVPLELGKLGKNYYNAIKNRRINRV